MPRDELKEGPVANRSCTDILFCLLFIVFLAGFGGVHWYGLQRGDPYLLLTTWDYDGYGCGYNESTKLYPYLYYPVVDVQAVSPSAAPADAARQILSFGTCVQECPTSDN